MPNRTTISRTALNDVYKCMLHETLKKIENGPKHVAITFDMWTDVSGNPYITFTLHQINDNFELQNFTLAT